jgi:hypothetical protein
MTRFFSQLWLQLKCIIVGDGSLIYLGQSEVIDYFNYNKL